MNALLLPLLVLSHLAAAERVICPVAADTYVRAAPWGSERPESSDAFDNHGAEPQLVIRGREYFSLLNFDLSSAKGMTVEKATLRLYRNANPWPVTMVGISTISGSGPWGEGKQQSGRSEPGAANYFWARTGEQPWAYPGSDVGDVTWGLGGSLYAYVKARDAGDGWYEIDVPAPLVYALATGDQYGWLLSDEKGQTGSRFSLASREQTARSPSLIIEGTRADRTPPGRVQSFKAESTVAEARALGRTSLRPGSVILRFGGAGDDKGAGVATHYELRYSRSQILDKTFSWAVPVPRWMLDPIAPKSHPLANANALRDQVTAVVEGLEPGQMYYVAARATDKAGNVGPVSTLGRFRAYERKWPALPALEKQKDTQAGMPVPPPVWVVPELLKINPRTGRLLEQADFLEHRARNSVWDGATATVKLTGARNEFVAFQLAIESAQPASGIEVRVTEPLFRNATLPPVFKSTGAIQLYREWFVPDDKNSSDDRPWYPDALLSLSGPLEIPARDNGVKGQTVQPVFVDIYIPKDAQPGLHTGALLAWNRKITVQVEVLPFTLPDKLSFTVDLNAYSGIPGYSLKRGTPEYRELVRAYHRMAHLNRANLDILGYSHSGSVEPDYSPPLTGEGADTKIASWADWDAQFGPLVNGSAFKDLPRAGVPIQALYLNFHENWPSDLRADYKWNNYPRPATTEDYRQLIARHSLESGPIEEGFPQSYQDRFSAVARQFAQHFRERGWTQTKYLVYFNNKHFYKDPARGGRGVCWWLLDEPNYRDDVRAISFFGYLAKRWLGEYPDVPIIFRTDISYIDFMRDLLSGQVDLNTVSRRFFTKNRYLMDHRDRYGRLFWNYSSTNHPRDTNVAMRAWAWSVWTAGGEGIVPWNTLVGSEAWNRAEPLTVFYTGSKFGKNEPFASIRLKAYRRGEQDVEYLALLAQKAGWDREAVSQAVTSALELAGEVRQTSEEDAGAISFQGVKDAALDNLRLRVAQALR